ncbi:hypothetical protein MRX96_015965 [Rhipicephalus microplus]
MVASRMRCWSRLADVVRLDHSMGEGGRIDLIVKQSDNIETSGRALLFCGRAGLVQATQSGNPLLLGKPYASVQQHLKAIRSVPSEQRAIIAARLLTGFGHEASGRTRRPSLAWSRTWAAHGASPNARLGSHFMRNGLSLDKEPS